MNCDWKRRKAVRDLNEAYTAGGELVLRFLDVSTGHVLHTFESTKFGQKRLADFYKKSSQMLNEDIEMYSSNGADDRENVDIVNYSYRAKIKAIGVDTDQIEKESAKQFEKSFAELPPLFTMSDRRKREHRKQFCERAELTAQAYHSAALYYLYSEYGYAAGRLPQLYREMRDLYNAFIVSYISSTASGDNLCSAVIKMYESELVEAGIYFENLKEKTKKIIEKRKQNGEL